MTVDANSILQAAASAAGSQQYPAGTLYIVATPIGNLADISLRAVHVLSLVDQVACEDTRMTQRLLQHLGLHRPLVALHQHNEEAAAQSLIAALQAGQRIAFVSDAGTPGVSDPGARLVRAVRAAGLATVPLPGASAATALISVAGEVQATGYSFVGFLPAKGPARREALQQWAEHPLPVVLFESPHRIADLAADLAATDPARPLTVGRELTKQFENILTLPARDFPAWLTQGQHHRGEFALVWHPRAAEQAAGDLPPDLLRLLGLAAEHLPLKEASRLLSAVSGIPRNRLYEAALGLREVSGPTD